MYLQQNNSKVPGEEYFQNAMTYYRKKFKNVLFVVATDSFPYVEPRLGNEPDVVLVKGKVNSTRFNFQPTKS